MASLSVSLNINDNSQGLQKVDLLLKRAKQFNFYRKNNQTIVYQTSG